MAQRFYNLVLLPRVRDDISEYKRLNFHLYMALKKALFKPGAWFKGKGNGFGISMIGWRGNAVSSVEGFLFCYWLIERAALYKNLLQVIHPCITLHMPFILLRGPAGEPDSSRAVANAAGWQE